MLLDDGKLGKLTVAELDKYLDHHNLPLRSKKADKVRSIVAHLAADVPLVEVQEDDAEEDEEDVIVGVIDSDSEDDDHDDDDVSQTESQSSSDDEQAVLQANCQVTRSGELWGGGRGTEMMTSSFIAKLKLKAGE